MNLKKTYHFTQDGREEGPYFQSQIIKMTETGIIRANATIRCAEDGESGPIGKLRKSLAENLKVGVSVTDNQMPFGSMVAIMVKWAFATLPAAIILFGAFAFVSGVASQIWTP